MLTGTYCFPLWTRNRILCDRSRVSTVAVRQTSGTDPMKLGSTVHERADVLMGVLVRRDWVMLGNEVKKGPVAVRGELSGPHGKSLEPRTFPR